MAQMHRKIEGCNHCGRPARALTDECGIRTIPHNHIAQIFLSVSKSEVELRHDGRHFKPRFAQGLSGFPRDQRGEGLCGEG